MIKVLKAIFSLIRYIFIILIFALIAVILTQKISNNQKSIAGVRIFTVITPSMVPEYEIGTAIIIKNANAEDIQIGDDITYLGQEESFKDKIVTHRVIKKEKKKDGTYRFVTKGIANTEEDPEINESQIYGKVLYKIKSITYLNGVIGNLYGMYFAIIVPIAVVMIWEIRSFRKDYDDEIENEDSEDEEKEEKRTKSRRNRRRERRRKRRKQWSAEKKNLPEDREESKTE